MAGKGRNLNEKELHPLFGALLILLFGLLPLISSFLKFCSADNVIRSISITPVFLASRSFSSCRKDTVIFLLLHGAAKVDKSADAVGVCDEEARVVAEAGTELRPRKPQFLPFEDVFAGT